MKTYLTLSIFLVLFAACKENLSLKISGSTSGFKDGTVLYLEDISGETSKILDSARVQSNHFEFNEANIPPVLKGRIRTGDFSDYKFLWLERGEITVETKKGDFRNAVITGSKTQAAEDELTQRLKPSTASQDSLNALYNNPKLTKPELADLDKKAEAIRQQQLLINADFISQNPSSMVSVSTLNIYATALGKQKTQKLYSNLSPGMKDTPEGKEVSRYLSLNKDLKIGDPYADFSQQDTAGKQVSISNFKGKVILIDFWASWCGPCRQENKELVKTYSAFHNKGFEVVGVSLDRDTEKQDWIAAIKKDQLTWPNISELTGDNNSAGLMYGVTGIPDNFLINKQGIIIARNLRGQALRDKLQELIK